MATDYYLKLEGIEGEVAGRAGEIELMSWSFGVTQSGTFASTSGGGAGRSTPGDMTAVSFVNKASPKLFLACAQGDHIPKATIVMRKAGGGQQDYMSIILSDCIVSSYQTNGSQGDERPTDTFSLNFAKMEYEYKPQKKDGTLDSPVKTGYDFALVAKV